jgi:N-hydroxyarylamine O-acetyltransferase
MATTDGRVTVSDRRLIITRNGKKQERLLNSEDEWKTTLEKYFGVIL